MGLDLQSLRMLLYARRTGCNFDRTLTLGRQDLLLTAQQLETEFARFGLQLPEADAQSLITSRGRFCEPVLWSLGAKQVDSLDASAFEGANIIHDLNEPVPQELDQKYDFVFDGGTLEHVFNFPIAITNLLRLVRVGGHVVITSPTNNQMGHGFYQFSPDLFFRLLVKANGYELQSMFMVPTFSSEGWYIVKDPARAGIRVGHNVASQPYSLFVLAKRIGAGPPMSEIPQQSDYKAEWMSRPKKGEESDRLWFFDASVAKRAVSANGVLKAAMKYITPKKALELWRAIKSGYYSNREPDPSLFQPVRLFDGE